MLWLELLFVLVELLLLLLLLFELLFAELSTLLLFELFTSTTAPPLDVELETLPELLVELDPLVLDVELTTIDPLLPPPDPPKKPPAKKPPPPNPPPPKPPVTTAGATSPPPAKTGAGGSGTGTGAPWLAIVTVVAAQACPPFTMRRTLPVLA